MAKLEVDMDGDGRPDHFALERIGDRVIVSVTLAAGTTSRLEFTASDFHCSVVASDAGCEGQPRSLEAFLLDPRTVADLALMYDLDHADVFVGNSRAAAVSVQPGDTDSFRFFWNAKSAQLDWLRL